jgi:hypothetical protein
MEALQMRVEDLDLEASLLALVERGRRFKTAASSAPIPIAGELEAILRRWLAILAELEAGRGGWLFPNRSGSGPWIDGGIGFRPTDQLKAAGERGRSGGIHSPFPPALMGNARGALGAFRHYDPARFATYFLADSTSLSARRSA